MSDAKQTWSTGRLLLTNDTKRWTKEERDKQDAIERTQIFTDFHTMDKGRGRKRVATFEGDNAAENASRAAECYNALAGIEDPAAFVEKAREQAAYIQRLEAERAEAVEFLKNIDSAMEHAGGFNWIALDQFLRKIGEQE